MSRRPDWSVLFVLPHLRPADPVGDDQRLALGLDGLSLAAAADPRVAEIRKWSSTIDSFLSSFQTEHGAPFSPIVLIGREDWLARFSKSAEPITSFRNLVALSDVFRTRASRSQSGCFWSDYYDFHPGQPSVSGGRVDVITPATSHYGIILKKYRWAADVGLPAGTPGYVDADLALRLRRVWRRRYLHRRDYKWGEPVFRSLEMAYHASSMRYKNYGSLYDVGSGASYWITALEILDGAEHSRTSRKSVRQLVGKAVWPGEELNRRRFRVPSKWKNHEPVAWESATPAVKVVDLLYEARNRFVHGKRVAARTLLPFGGGSGMQLLAFASTIYRAALVAYLERHWPVKRYPSLGIWRDSFWAGAVYPLHLRKLVDDGDW